ncbi:MAG: hypothetical protein LBK66_13860 [Spirochaetaceae bacterium]|nr:hypothetical protein [Spirochaetaceae bacterium]
MAASKTGSGDLYPGGPGTEWTLTYPDNQNIYAFYSDVKITSTKSVNGGDYRKDFILKFKKIVDANYPASYWATQTGAGNGVSIIKDGNQYYEVHTFITSGTLNFFTTPSIPVIADYLIVAGGGGAGGLLYENETGKPLTLEAGSVTITVGAGGATEQQGNAGGNSAIGNIVVPGGGAPWTVPSDTSWVSSVTGGTTEFSRGGNGGGTNSPASGASGANYGDGGSAGKNPQMPGGSGHSGIVVIRFPAKTNDTGGE